WLAAQLLFLLSFFDLSIVGFIICMSSSFFFFFTVTAPTDIYTLSLHDALPIFTSVGVRLLSRLDKLETLNLTATGVDDTGVALRSEEHTSELQSLRHLVCRLLLEKKKKNKQ